jgi:hypothetical protein
MAGVLSGALDSSSRSKLSAVVLLVLLPLLLVLLVTVLAVFGGMSSILSACKDEAVALEEAKEGGRTLLSGIKNGGVMEGRICTVESIFTSVRASVFVYEPFVCMRVYAVAMHLRMRVCVCNV